MKKKISINKSLEAFIVPSLIEFKDERGLSEKQEASCKNFPQSDVGEGMKREREPRCVCS